MSGRETVNRRIVVEGLVQGVGYRDFTRRAALKFNVFGWVRNRPDGTVEAFAWGARSDVEALIAEMRRGPRGATVSSLRLVEPGEDDSAESETFVIRSTG